MRDLHPNNLILSVLGMLAIWSQQMAYGGGSGLNVIVVVNQNSSNSCALGNYYCERRQVPPDNVLRINWAGDNISWTADDLQTNLVNPLLSMLAAQQLTNQVDFVMLSMDIPFETWMPAGFNGTTSALFYGLKNESATDLNSSYYASEKNFRQARPSVASGYSFLCTMLTSTSLAEAKHLIDQGVASDGTLPAQPVLLAKSSDPLRNIRFNEFDNTVIATGISRLCSVIRTNCDSPTALANLFGFQTGLAKFNISPNTFVPGAMADSMTSYAGVIFGHNDQTSLLAFINAGASGSYGTVTEPSPLISKFPSPQNYFYQSRGFSLAECYYQSLQTPFQGLIVGEPLAAPFRQAAAGVWLGTASNAVVSGTAAFSGQFTAVDSAHPLQQVDLFVDGKFFCTITNVPPTPGNIVTMVVGGTALNYTVPVDATINSIAADIVNLINGSSMTNLTSTVASLHGDRIELHYVATNIVSPPQRLASVTNRIVSTGLPPKRIGTAAGSGKALTTFAIPARVNFLNSPVAGLKTCCINGTIQAGSWLQLNVTKTNGTRVAIGVTNLSQFNTVSNFASQFADAINSAPALQGVDGLTAEDSCIGLWGAYTFHLRARSRGWPAAGIRVNVANSGSFIGTPATDGSLNENLADLQPRNHVYIGAGSTNLLLHFALDTTTLTDGYHLLTAAAYEGTSVATQTRMDLPIVVRNSSLTAVLTLLDPGATNSVQDTYHVQVSVNTTDVKSVELYSTGGLVDVITNQSNCTFAVVAARLGAGLHPLYSVVQTTSGSRYRTEPQYVLFQ